VKFDTSVLTDSRKQPDSAQLEQLVALRSGGVFDSLVDQKNSGLGILKLIGQ